MLLYLQETNWFRWKKPLCRIRLECLIVIRLKAALEAIGLAATIFHLTDNQETIKTKLQELLQQFDVIILSGGVSKGKFDFVPETLTELGVEKSFIALSKDQENPFGLGCKLRSNVLYLLFLVTQCPPLLTFTCISNLGTNIV